MFDSAQQTFPKLLQKAGYQTALVGKWHLESLPSGFNYWEIVPGQGDYYNPDFITQDNDTVQKHGYITNLITDDAIDWMENSVTRANLFCLLFIIKLFTVTGWQILVTWLCTRTKPSRYPITSLTITRPSGCCGTGDEYREGHGHDL